MLYQNTKGKTLKPWLSFALIIGGVAGVYIVNWLLEKLVGSGTISFTVASVLLWAYTIVSFLFIFTRYCLVSVYEMDGVKLVFSRIYIAKPRLIEQLMLRDIAFFGSPLQAATKYKLSSTKRFTSRRSPYAVQAIVFKRNNKWQAIEFNPNEEFCTAIVEYLKAN